MTTTKSRKKKVVSCTKCPWQATALDKYDAERALKDHRQLMHSDH